MLNKSIAFGLLAAGLMIAPTAAFAGQSQSVDQYTEQNGAAVNGSSTVQTSRTNSRQVQNQNSLPRLRPLGTVTVALAKLTNVKMLAKVPFKMVRQPMVLTLTN
jgi:hypothetical protein